MTDGHCSYPLTLDIRALKQRYASLINLTTYQRANKRALEHRRAAWATYRPLAKDQLYDSLDPIMTTIRSPYTNGTSRHTKNGVWHSQAAVVYRPTEHMAIAHALGLYTFASDDPVVRQDPHLNVWYCIQCKVHKPLTEFAHDKTNIHGLAFACKRCQDESKRRVYKIHIG